MTHPNTPEPRPDHRPNVDEVIHDAREASWHLPESQSEQPDLGRANQPGEPPAHLRDDARGAASAAANATRTPATAAHAAPASNAIAASPATAPSHGSAAGHAGASAHGAASAHGGGHDAAHSEDSLGPIDVEMWRAGVAGAAIGLFMAVCFVLATSGSGAY